MTPLIRISFASALTAMAAASSTPVTANPTGAGQDHIAGRQTFGLAALPNPATETFRGTVASVDEGRDTIGVIRRPSETAEELKVQDGLLFNSVRYGDQVEITVENIAGARTIVGLTKE